MGDDVPPEERRQEDALVVPIVDLRNVGLSRYSEKVLIRTGMSGLSLLFVVIATIPTDKLTLMPYAIKVKKKLSSTWTCRTPNRVPVTIEGFTFLQCRRRSLDLALLYFESPQEIQLCKFGENNSCEIVIRIACSWYGKKCDRCGFSNSLDIA